MRVVIDNTAFDALPNPLTRDLVNSTTDAVKLTAWYEALIEKAAEMAEFSQALAAADYESEGAAGKCAFCKIAARWCEQRLLVLGHPVPYPLHDPRSRELRRKEARIQALRKQVRDLGGDPDESRVYQPGEAV